MKAVVSAVTAAQSPAGRQVQGRVPADATCRAERTLRPTARRSGQHSGERGQHSPPRLVAQLCCCAHRPRAQTRRRPSPASLSAAHPVTATCSPRPGRLSPQPGSALPTATLEFRLGAGGGVARH